MLLLCAVRTPQNNAQFSIIRSIPSGLSLFLSFKDINFICGSWIKCLEEKIYLAYLRVFVVVTAGFFYVALFEALEIIQRFFY
jgi:hypothetical protein